ncbi:MAG: MOSC domain-containing protein, partial [Pyrinomonadaceae bacterium]
LIADEGVRVPMNRFRPNIVVSGSGAYAEDNWSKIRIGDTVFRSTKPCERCVVTTVDQAKGDFAGKEPLRTLATYRMAKDVMPERFAQLGVGENAVLFGQNLIVETHGATIKIGDKVEIID